MKRSLGFLYFLFVIYYVLMMANGIVIEKGSPLVLGFNILFFGYMLFLNTFKNKYLPKFFIIYVFLMFVLVLILNTSSEYYESLRLFAKYAIALLAFPAGFNLLRGGKAYKNLTRLSICFLVLFLINYAVSTIFHLGGSNVLYGAETSVETGNLFDEALYLNVCIMVLVPLFFVMKTCRKDVILILTVACIIVTIVCMKRMVILCIGISILMYLLLTRMLNAKYGRLSNTFIGRMSLGQLFLAVVLVVAAGAMYWDTFQDQLEARSNELNRSIDEETRFEEITAIYDDIYNYESNDVVLLGKETFHTVGTYAGGQFGDRMIHTNFGIMLNGTGFIGLAFYIILNLYFIWIFFRNLIWKTLAKDSQARHMFVVYLIFWLTYNIASFSGTIWLTIYPAFNFLVMGGILRFFRDKKYQALKKSPAYERQYA